MRLTFHTDYAMRMLLYLGSHPGEVVPVSAIGAAYGISVNHLAKIAKSLVRDGFVRARRGNTGGLELARPPSEIGIGAMVRRSEPDLTLVECLDPATNTCPLRGVCRLEGALRAARDAFLAELDAYTLADLLENAPQLLRALSRGPLPKKGPRRVAQVGG